VARVPDGDIPPEEPLYRSVGADGVNGEDVLPFALELPQCSFNRSKYSHPEQVLVPRPEHTGILSVRPLDLPGPVPRHTGSPYEFFAADDPNPKEDLQNDAHCEVRIKPQGLTFSKNHKVKKEILAKALDELARKVRIFRTP